MQTRFPLAILLCFFGVVLLGGCVAPNETPDAERAAAKQSMEKANNAANESQKRVDAGNAVLDGK